MSDLLTKEQIVEKATPYTPHNPAVYFLVDGDEVVYVGQSLSPRDRIAAHWRTSGKIFDKILVLPCSADKLNEVEARYIVALQPKYNNSLPPTADYWTPGQMKNEIGVTGHDINRAKRKYGIKPVFLEYYDFDSVTLILECAS